MTKTILFISNSKSIVTRIAKVLICVFITCIMLYICYKVLENKDSLAKYTDFYQSDRKYDVVFLGTSHVYFSVLPLEIWKKYGISSYNWGYNSCTTAETYYLLKEITKYQRPKLVVLDLYGLMEYDKQANRKHKETNFVDQHIQFDSLPLSLNKIQAVEDIFDDYDKRYEFIWNFITYHHRWNTLTQQDFQPKKNIEKGASPEFRIYRTSPTHERILDANQLDSVCYNYLQLILEYCDKNEIPVLAIYIPYINSKTYDAVAATINKYSRHRYLNLFDYDLVNFEVDANDGTHLNYSGALKISDWLGKYIKENYELSDYSQDEAWNEDYLQYSNYKIERLKQETALSKILLQLSDSFFTTKIAISSDDILSSNKNLKALIDNTNAQVNVGPLNNNICLQISVSATSSAQQFTHEIKYKCTANLNEEIDHEFEIIQ